MGDIEKVVDIIFRGQDEISGSLKNITSSLDSLNLVGETFAKPFAALADGVLKADAALATLVAGGIALASSQFASFEDQMLKVKGVIGANDQEYQLLTKTVEELGIKTKFSASEVAQGLEFLALSGLKTNQAIEALPSVLNLAQAAGSDLGTTTEILTKIMAGFSLEAKDLGKVQDVLTATFTNSTTDVEQLGKAFSFVGPIAKTLGLSIEETSATLGVLATAGYQADRGGTALRNILVALIAPAGNMSKLFKELGVDTNELGIDLASSKDALQSLGVQVKDSSGKVLPFSNIVEQIREGLSKIPSEADRTAALIEIFGKRGGPELQALLNQGVGAIGKLQDKINESGGITQKIADEMESGLGGAFRRILSSFEGVFIKLGRLLAQGVKPISEGVALINVAINKVLEGDTLKPIFDYFKAFGVKVSNIFKEVAKNIPDALKDIDLDKILDALDILSESLINLFDGIDLTTPEGLKTALQKVADTIASLINITAGMVEAFKPFFNAILGYIESVNNMDSESQKSLGSILGVAKAIKELGVTTAGIILAIGDASKKLAPVFTVITNTIAGGFDLIVIFFQTIKLGVLEIVEDIVSLAQKFAKAFKLTGFANNLNDTKQAIQAWKQDTETSLFDAASSATKHLTGISVDFSKLKNNIPEKIESEITTRYDPTNIEIAQDQFKGVPKELVTILTTEINNNDIKTVKAILDGTIKPLKEPIVITPKVESKAAAKNVKEFAFMLKSEIPSEKSIIIKSNHQESIQHIKEIAGVVKDEIPEEAFIAISAAIDQGDLNKAVDLINSSIKDKELQIVPYISDTSVKNVNKKFEEITFYKDSEGFKTIKVPIEPEVDKEKKEKVEKDADELAKKLDPLKVLEIKAELEKKEVDQKIEEIKLNASSAQAAMEFKAKVDVAEVEAAVELIVNSFESINEGMKNTGDTITDALDSLQNSTSYTERWAALDLIDQTMDLRQQEFDLQKKLIEQQTKNLELKNKALKENNGEMAIKIESTGLEPALEMVMWQILQKIQARASASTAEFLLGLKGEAAK